MLNRPTSTWSEDSSGGYSAWDVDGNPRLRFGLLVVGFLAPLILIGARVAQLQLQLQNDFASRFSKTIKSREEISARTGRILSADGSVLATDSETFDISVHFPVIQIPPDNAWIETKASPRLSKKDRRNPEKFAAEKKKVLEEVQQFWDELARLTNRRAEDILASRRQIQTRVEQLKSLVQERHRSAAMPSEARPEESSAWLNFIAWLQSNPTQDRSDGPDRILEETQYHSVITDVSADVRDEIKAHAMRYPYAQIRVQTRRIYPQIDLAAHFIGHRKPLSAEAMKERQTRFPDGDPQDYRTGDLCGVSGLEREYDALLKGTRGVRVLIKNRRGEIIEIQEDRPPQHGRDLVLTIDSATQRQAEKILDGALKKVIPPEQTDLEASRKTYNDATCPQGGVIVAIDVHTGAIVALAAAPRFDLNLLVTPDRDRWDDLMSDKRRPMFPRSTKMKLTPGSVFKVITAVAAIESGKIAPEELCQCHGYLDSPNKPHRCYTFIHQGVGHGGVDLADALSRSCNVYFYRAARRIGAQTIADWAREFGIGEATGIDLPSEEPGRLPAPDTKKNYWKPSDTLDLAIGQSTLEITPLQIARVMAAIANDGYLVTPRLAANSGPMSTDESDSYQRLSHQNEARRIQGLQSQTLEHVRQGLAMAVNDPHGTAYKTVRMKEVTIAGKTGTAQTNGVDHAWFAGYVPAERPRIAFAVVLEHGGSGGKAAGPIAHDFIQALLDQNLLKATKLVVDRN